MRLLMERDEVEVHKNATKKKKKMRLPFSQLDRTISVNKGYLRFHRRHCPKITILVHSAPRKFLSRIKAGAPAQIANQNEELASYRLRALPVYN